MTFWRDLLILIKLCFRVLLFINILCILNFILIFRFKCFSFLVVFLYFKNLSKFRVIIGLLIKGADLIWIQILQNLILRISLLNHAKGYILNVLHKSLYLYRINPSLNRVTSNMLNLFTNLQFQLMNLDILGYLFLTIAFTLDLLHPQPLGIIWISKGSTPLDISRSPSSLWSLQSDISIHNSLIIRTKDQDLIKNENT